MALISNIVAADFRTGSDFVSVVEHLDHGLSNVGISVRLIREMVLHGSPGSGTAVCDPDEVAAAAESLLAYLGQLGLLIDRLDAMTGARFVTDAA